MTTEMTELKKQYGALFDTVSAALYASDPLGINTGGNTDVYDSETGTILPRLKDAHSADDVQVILYEEFVRRVTVSSLFKAAQFELSIIQFVQPTPVIVALGICIGAAHPYMNCVYLCL